MSFAAFLKSQRQEAGLSSRGLASAAGVSAATISRLENSTLSPSKDLAAKLAEALRQDESAFLLAAGFVSEELRKVVDVSPAAAAEAIRTAVGDATTLSDAKYFELLEGAVVAIKQRLESEPSTAVRFALAEALREEDPSALAPLIVVSALCVRLLGERAPFAPDFIEACSEHLDEAVVTTARSHCLRSPDMLGPTFERLVARESRYQHGQYFTPVSIARHMAELLADSREAPVVLDPACGAGVLLAAVAERYPKARLVANDIHPVCCLLTRAGLATRGLKVQVVELDFTAPQDLFSCHGSRADVDAIICNPPYVRHHLLGKTQKKELAARYGAAHGVEISTLSTNYVYFFLEAINRLKPSGQMVFITPADYLDVKYGEALKSVFASSHTISRLELFNRDDLAFDGVLTTSAITVLKKTPPAPGNTTPLFEAYASSTEVGTKSRRDVDLMTIALDTSWTLQFGDNHASHQELRHGRDNTLADYMKTRRGIATGANKFFVINQETVETWSIEKEFLVPVVASARDLPDRVLTREHWEKLRAAGRPVWLLDCGLPPEQLGGTRVKAYLDHGRELGVHERFNCATRKPWYKMERVEPPDIIITYMNRGKTRFVRNDAGCRVMSVFLNGFITDDGLDVDRLLDVLNDGETSELITQIGRTYGGGLGKIEPRELLKLPMPSL